LGCAPVGIAERWFDRLAGRLGAGAPVGVLRWRGRRLDAPCAPVFVVVEDLALAGPDGYLAGVVDESLDAVIGVVGRAGLRDPPVLASAPAAGLRRGRSVAVGAVDGRLGGRVPARTGSLRVATNQLVAVVAVPVPPACAHASSLTPFGAIIHDCHRPTQCSSGQLSPVRGQDAQSFFRPQPGDCETAGQTTLTRQSDGFSTVLCTTFPRSWAINPQVVQRLSTDVV
jgi:hypothetical protein